MTPLARSLAFHRKLGHTIEKVEYWNAYAHIRKDLFGCIDALVIDGQRGCLGVQATSDTNVSHRVAKAKASPLLAKWLAAGLRFQVEGWAKRKGRWQVRVVEVAP